MEFRLRPVGWALQRAQRNPETKEPEGDRTLVFQDVGGDAVGVGPMNEEAWAMFVEFVNDPVGAAERMAARSKIVQPGG